MCARRQRKQPDWIRWQRDVLLPKKGLEEVDNCARRLARFDAERDDQVSEIRVLTDDRETKRRANEEALRVDRRHKLLFEAESSARRNAAITMKWTVLYDIEVPMDLHNEMKAQEAACWRIIEAKDNLIRDFQAELKAKDEQYVKALRQGVQDLDQMQDTMARTAQRQRMLFEQELHGIEAAFEDERTELVDRCRQEWDDLFEKSYQQNMRHKASREKRIDSNQTRLGVVQRHDTEEFYTLKVRLETEVQNLEQQLEDMRATYQLNTEKLEYNFRVLHERNQENHKTISNNKRKLARLQDNLSHLKSRYKAIDNKFKSENVELSDAFKRYTQLLMDLSDKLSRFVTADARRFEDVWGMHEESVKSKLLRLLQADKLIHEQQLGLLWFPPSEEELNDVFEQQRRAAKEEMRQRMLLGNPNIRHNKSAEVQAEEASDARALAKTMVQTPAIRDLCAMIADNTGFLRDEQLRQVLASLPHDKAEQVAIDKVLKAIGVKTAEDAKMLQLFCSADAQHATPEQLQRMVKRVTARSRGGGGGGDLGGTHGGQGGQAEELMVSDTEVVECVKNFLSFRKALLSGDDDAAAAAAAAHNSDPLVSAADSAAVPGSPRGGGGGSPRAAMASPTATAPAAKAGVGRKKEKQMVDPITGQKDVLSANASGSIWKICANVVPADTVSVWKELYKFQTKYNLVLKERCDLIASVDRLRVQNRELKMLLNQYLTSKVNGQLYVPPTATISRVDA